MAKKVKKMAFGGLSRAVRNNISRMPAPDPRSMAPAGAPMGAAPLPNATKVMPKTGGIASNALNAIKAAGAANPQMVKPAGNAMGAAPMPVPGRFQRASAPRMPMKKGGAVKSSASKRADGIAKQGKTKGRII